MSTTSGARTAAMVVVLVVAVVVGGAEAAVTCRDAVNALVPCGSFLLGAGPAQPSGRCCQSAVALRDMAGTAAERRALCKCLQQSGPSFGVLPERARALPARCNLNLTIPISTNIDCDKIP